MKTFLAVRWWILIVILIAAGAIAGAGYLGYQASLARQADAVQPPPTVAVSRGEVKYSVTAPGSLVDGGEATLEAHVSGRVDAILVKPGDAVKAGQILVQLGDRAHFETLVTAAKIQVMEAQKTLNGMDDTLELAQAQADLATAQANYRTAQQRMNGRGVVRGDKVTIDAARANIILLQKTFKDAEQAYNSVAQRPDTDYEKALALSRYSAAKQTLEIAQINLTFLETPPDAITVADAQAQLDLTKAQLDQAQAHYDQLKSGINPDRDLSEAQLRNAQAGLIEAQAALQALEVKAPFDGIITQVLANAGQSVGVGTNLLTESNPQAVEVSATVVEEDLPLVQVRQKVQLYFDALPDQTQTGTVARIIPRRTGASQAIYPIAITLDALNPQLVPGMTVDCSLTIADRVDVLRLPRAVVRAHLDGTAVVDIWANGQIEHRNIRVGLRGDSFVEVTQGLAEGEQVVAR